MFTITTAAQGCTATTHEKGYAKASSALLAGKRLLTNQEGGSVEVFGEDGVVMSATKRNWVWRENRMV